MAEGLTPCIVANVARGTKHFREGTKVLVDLPLWDPGHGKTYLLGLRRGGGRKILLIGSTKWLGNFRVKLAPARDVAKLPGMGACASSKRSEDDVRYELRNWVHLFETIVPY